MARPWCGVASTTSHAFGPQPYTVKRWSCAYAPDLPDSLVNAPSRNLQHLPANSSSSAAHRLGTGALLAIFPDTIPNAQCLTPTAVDGILPGQAWPMKMVPAKAKNMMFLATYLCMLCKTKVTRTRNERLSLKYLVFACLVEQNKWKLQFACGFNIIIKWSYYTALANINIRNDSIHIYYVLLKYSIQ